MSEPLIKVENLKKYFPLRGGFLNRVEKWIKALDGVDFHIDEKETLGLVGESGCGKTTLARTLLQLIEPTGGKVFFQGQNIYQMDSSGLKELRRKAQIVFQDPFTSLNPRMTIRKIISEPLITHKIAERAERSAIILEMLENVGLKKEHLRRYPHEFSGGQRQRIAIARVLVLHPEFLVLDEPTSALDVSVQSQILNLLMELRERFTLTCLFISHDLGVIRYLCDRVGVMYLSKIIEIGDAEEIFESPTHPYTQALISSILPLNPEVKRKRIILKGEVPSPIDPPSGCRFYPRCSFVKPICNREEPQFISVGRAHQVACHLYSS